MECPRKGWLSGVAALLLLLPGAVSSQTPPTASKEPPKTEVDRLIFKGVKSVDRKDLKLSLYTDASHCVSLVLTPLCWLTHAHYVYARKFLNHDELKRDVLRAEVYYWKRGFRETVVDTLVQMKGEKHANVSFLVNEGLPTLVSGISVTQAKPVLSEREIADRLVLKEKTPLSLIKLDSTVVFI
jgi:outer membrane protein assembly factor BamA